MREIKVRVFVQNRWVHFVVGQNWGTVGNELYREAVLQRLPFFEYTGMKDSNGVEIYVGDILSYDGADHERDNKWMENPCYIVDYKRDGVLGGIDIKPERKMYFHGFRFKHTIVMGNIHLNPELLYSPPEI